MKPPAFDYLRATDIAEVWEALDRDDDAKVIAGGQSLVPLMNLRFAAPSLLIDITGLEGLTGITVSERSLRIGALNRHAEVEKNPLVRKHAPLLARAASWVAHPQIRNRGTLGGSVAHSDAAAEFPAALLALDATMIVRSRRQQRRVRAIDFFDAHFTTALAHGELLAAVELPIGRPGSCWGFEEFARRRGDYAIGGAAVYGERSSEGICLGVRAGLLSAGPAPCLASGLAEAMVGHVVDASLIDRTVQAAMEHVTPNENVHGAPEYRRDVIAEMLRRALNAAFAPMEVA